MSLTLHDLTLRNFLSTGNVKQTIKLDDDKLKLVLGENLDSDVNGERNACGKTAIINAICYALYGKPLVPIKLDNLVNKTNEKSMEVSIRFTKDGKEYRIDRGRKPTFLKFIVDNKEVNKSNLGSEDDETQGENRKTQEHIERILQCPHELFKHIIAPNTFVQPFLELPVSSQRFIIENLLGISILTDKAEVLKEKIKETKDSIKEEEFAIDAIKKSNDTIQKNITNLKKKSKQWEKDHQKNIGAYERRLGALFNIDINKEIENHAAIDEYENFQKEFKNIKRHLRELEKNKKKHDNRADELRSNLEYIKDNTCYTCKQELHEIDGKTVTELTAEINEQLQIEINQSNQFQKEIDEYKKQISGIDELLGDSPEEPYYDTIKEAYNHQSNIQHLKESLDNEQKRENPYTEQIKSLENEGLQEISYEKLNELTKEKEHQEFLLKILVNKDSFIRKKIIDQNLPYLNERLNIYTSQLNLKHVVEFQNDLSVEISEYGRYLDFANLSRGERTRLILSLSWAFRDIWESLNGSVNMLFIDELIDSGLDTSGAESALHVLKEMNRRFNKSIFLISHKEELLGRVDEQIMVYMHNGFSSIEEITSE